MRRLVAGLGMVLVISTGFATGAITEARAQTAMDKAGTMAGHCQQPVKKQDGSQVKNAAGHIVTMDCPKQGSVSHPALAPQDRRQP